MAGDGSSASLRLGVCLAALTLAFGAAQAKDHSLHLAKAQIEPLTFAALDGWSDDNQAEAFAAFLKSCKAIRAGSKAMRKGAVFGALYEVCGRAAALDNPTPEKARKFFEDNFKPVKVSPTGEQLGFLTGYYETEFEGSRFPSPEFKYPMFGRPSNLVMPKDGKSRPGRKFGRRKTVPYYDRSEIEDGILAGRGLEICWVKNPVDSFFAQIQGSTRVKLDSGPTLRLNYDSHNGLPYTPVGKFLIERGIVSREDMSMDKIREYMEANPKEGDDLRRKNRSFVFFREVPLGDKDECIGAQGVPLTPWRSLAMDKKIHVYGTPFWIEAELPITSEKPETRFRRLLIAQDTGSAITGPARADIYFGAGEEIGHVAGRIKQFGKFVMLVPRSVAIGEDPKEIPLPRPRPVISAEKAQKTTSDATDGAASPLPKARPKT